MRDREQVDSISFILAIAIGVFIGALAAAFVYEGITALRARYALQEFEKTIRAVGAETERAAQQQVIEAQRKLAEQESSLRANRAALELVQRLERERVQRKSDAWTKFYQPSLPCAADSGTGQCANEYMAAKKRFEQTYVDR